MSKISISYKFSDYSGDNTLYDLKVWVYETSNNIPAEIFLVNGLPEVPEDVYADHEFIKVCSYADMINYPLTEEDNVTTYRVGQLWFRDKSLYALYNKLTEIQTGVQSLINDIVNTNTDTPTVYTTITG